MGVACGSGSEALLPFGGVQTFPLVVSLTKVLVRSVTFLRGGFRHFIWLLRTSRIFCQKRCPHYGGFRLSKKFFRYVTAVAQKRCLPSGGFRLCFQNVYMVLHFGSKALPSFWRVHTYQAGSKVHHFNFLSILYSNFSHVFSP